MKKIRLLIIGLTSYHDEHIRALKLSSLVKIVGICNTNDEAAKKVSLIFDSTEYFRDYKMAIITLKPDAIFLSLPHDKYFEIIEFATKRNIHIFKEKPFSLNLDEAKKIIKIYKNTNSKLMLVSQRRFHSTYVEGASVLNKIGAIRRIEASYTFKKQTKGWRKSIKRSGGGVIIDSGYHIIDILNYYFGLPEVVICKIEQQSHDRLCETEDYVSIKFQYTDGKTASLILSRITDTKNEKIVIFGDQGKIIITKNELLIEMYSSHKKILKLHVESNFDEAYVKQHNSFFSSLSDKSTLTPSIKEGINNSVVIEACYISASRKSHSININELILSKGISL